MNAFPLPMDLRNLSDGSKEHWETLSPFVYRDPILGLIIVPAGMSTDLASVPRVFWLEIDPTNDVAPAALAHDWLYATRGVLRVGQPNIARPQADAALYRALRANGVGWLRAKTMWASVRAFGQDAWDEGVSPEGLLAPGIVADVERQVYQIAHAEPDDAGPERMG